MSPAIAIAAIVFTVLVFLDVLRSIHATRLLHPRISESDEESAAHCHAELDGAGLPAGLIDHFHNRSTKTNLEQDHA